MSEWISVKDRLPDKSDRYLVIPRCAFGLHQLLAIDRPYPCCEVNIAYYAMGYHEMGRNPWYWCTDDEGLGRPNVTHWMPLPKPPGES